MMFWPNLSMHHLSPPSLGPLLSRWLTAMEKGSSSRIPKLTFGFRKSPKNNGTISEGNSPRGGGFGVAQTRAITPTPTGLHSAPGSSNTSPNLSRSKSLRVPRSNLQSLKSRSNSALQEEEPQGGRGDNLKSRSSTSLLERNSIRESSNHTPSRGAAGSVVFRPRSKTIGSAGRRAINRHSRSVSPSKVIGDNETNDVDSIDKDSIEVSVARGDNGFCVPWKSQSLISGIFERLCPQ